MREQSGDMDRIQQDAMRRMQEMQARAKIQQPHAQQQNTQQGNMGHNPHKPQAPQRSAPHGAPPPQRETPPAKMPEEKKPIASPAHNDLLGSLFEDKERSLILILILILSSEKADSSLILALMYLII
ncbi:MAG: hypothetical protein U0I48_04900 [Acutalibacteraceae bacterium]|nr:hypothetical protein [Acutalibacteraceae bacterium]